MPTINQLIRKPRTAPTYRNTVPAMQACPQKRGVCTRVYTQTSTARPDAASITIRAHAVDGHLFERARVVPYNPAVPRVLISMSSPSDVNHSIVQCQRRPLVFPQWVEGQLAALGTLTRSWHARLNCYWTAELLGSRRDVQSVQPLHIVHALFRLSHHVQSATGLINHWCSGYSNFIGYVTAFARIAAGNGRDAGTQEADLPERTAAQPVGIPGIHAVVFRCDVYDIMESVPGDAHISHVKRRRERDTIHCVREKFSELGLVHVAGSQYRLVAVPTRPEVVIVVCERAGIISDINGRT